MRRDDESAMQDMHKAEELGYLVNYEYLKGLKRPPLTPGKKK